MSSRNYTSAALKLIESLKVWLVVKPLQLLYSTQTLESKLAAMRMLPSGTVGNDLAKMLDRHKLQLVPMFYEHDLNHVILGYGMESDEELCMQAYLIGNRYFKWQCFVFLASAIIVPRLWPSLWKHFLLGRSRRSVIEIDFEQCLGMNTNSVRKYFNTPMEGLRCFSQVSLESETNRSICF